MSDPSDKINTPTKEREEMPKKMTIVPTREGIMYECYYCKTTLSPEQADQHGNCEAE